MKKALWVKFGQEMKKNLKENEELFYGILK